MIQFEKKLLYDSLIDEYQRKEAKFYVKNISRNLTVAKGKMDLSDHIDVSEMGLSMILDSCVEQGKDENESDGDSFMIL